MRALDCPTILLSVLWLKISAPLMLMWNMDPNNGLYNGTRMTLLYATTCCLEVCLDRGQFDGQIRLLFPT